MGTFGAGIFHDDVALDVRTAFRDLVGEGLTATAATKQICKDFRQEIEDTDDGPIFWLALAATQWELGRLQTRVKVKALRVIDKGIALKNWQERTISPATIKRRAAALTQLKKKLLFKQPATKKVAARPTVFSEPAWKVGRSLAYRLESGSYALLFVERCIRSQHGCSIIFTVADWVGKRLPPAGKIQKLRVKRDDDFKSQPFLVCIWRKKEHEFPEDRIVWIANTRKPFRTNWNRPRRAIMSRNGRSSPNF